MKALHLEPTVKPDLLTLSEEARVEVMKLVREQFRQMVIEAKLWQTMLELEDSSTNEVDVISKSGS